MCIKNAKLQRRSRLGPFQYKSSQPLFCRLLCPSLWTAAGGQTATLDQTDLKLIENKQNTKDEAATNIMLRSGENHTDST